MSVLSTQRVPRLTIGDSLLDGIFSGFGLGELVVLQGKAASFMSFVLSVRCQMPVESGGLDSPVVFVDGGNSFNPYLVAELARCYGLDSKSVLEKIHVSRAFTAYQFSSLILKKLEAFLRSKRAKLLVVSDVSLLFLDKDVPRVEAKDLFMKVCSKLSEIAADNKIIVAASYFPERRNRLSLFFDTMLFGRSNILAKIERTRKALSFSLESYPRNKSIHVDFSSDYAPLKVLAEA